MKVQELVGKTVARIERLHSPVDQFKIVFTDKSFVTVRTDSLYDKNGNYVQPE